MKIELNSDFMQSMVSEVITDLQKVDVRNINPTGTALSVGTKFAILGVANFKESSTIPAYQGLIVCLENGKNMPLSIRTLKGTYFQAEQKNGIITNVPIIVPTAWNKSGQDILTFIENNKNKLFVVTERKEYKTLPYGKESEQITRTAYFPIIDFYKEEKQVKEVKEVKEKKNK